MLLENTIHLGDCLELMKDIPEASVDMILCDLPYGSTSCKWDAQVPLEPLWSAYRRIIKKGGAIVLCGKEPFNSLLRQTAIDLFKYDWIWKKSRKNGFVHAKGAPLQEHETISVFSFAGIQKKSRNKMVYFPQGVIPFTAERINYVKTMRTHSGGHKVGSTWQQKGVFYPTSILSFKNESPKSQIHPTQKPIALFEYLIKTYTNPGDLVLDNCAGSGTTAVACKQTGRRYLCIEKDRDYWLKACERVSQSLGFNEVSPLASRVCF